MNKKSFLFDCLVTFLLSFSLLLVSFFSTKYVAKGEVENELKYYADEISSIYKTNDDTEVTTSSFSKISNIRISIFDLEANNVLEINALEKEAATEDRKNELEENIGKYYYKESLTLGYPVLYYIKKTDSFYIRVGMPRSIVEGTANAVLLYGSIALISIDIIYFVYRYIRYKKALNELKIEVNKLEALSSKQLDSLSEIDSFETMDKVIANVSSNLEDKIESLRRENSKVDYILDSMEEGLIVLNEQNQVILINKYALRTLSLQKEDVYLKEYLYLLLGESFKEKISEVKEKESASIDLKIKGKIYQAILSLIPLNWTSENSQCGIGIVLLDVSEQRMNEKLKRDFFQNASHELKTPLTTIIGYSELLSNSLITDKDEQDKALSTIVNEAKRMKTVIDDMLSLANLEAKSNEELLTKIDAKKACEEIINSLKLIALEKEVTITSELSLVSLEISLNDFERLVTNLLSNAIFYNKRGGEVKVTLTENYLCVEDNGIGIEEKYQQRIFERFYRVDKSRSRKDGGTGLGLAIVKHICINYNYKIELISHLHEGSKFIIHFN